MPIMVRIQGCMEIVAAVHQEVSCKWASGIVLGSMQFQVRERELDFEYVDMWVPVPVTECENCDR